MIISDHNTSYRNHFYNSIFDDDTNIGFIYHNETDGIAGNIQDFIANVTITIGNAVYAILNNKEFIGSNKNEDLFKLVL